MVLLPVMVKVEVVVCCVLPGLPAWTRPPPYAISSIKVVELEVELEVELVVEEEVELEVLEDVELEVLDDVELEVLDEVLDDVDDDVSPVGVKAPMA